MQTVAEWKQRVLLINVLIFLIGSLITAFVTYGTDQHVELAKSFLSGRLDFAELPKTLSDVGLFNGKYYWHLPPMHVFLLIPFVVLFGPNLNYIYGPLLHVFINYSLFYIAYLLATEVLGKDRKWEALLLAFALCFSTVQHLNFEVAWIYYTLHSLCVLFLLLSIYGRVTKKSSMLVGMCVALAFLSRYNAILTVPFLMFPYLKTPRRALAFLLPLTVAVILIGAYNRARFGSFVDFGYNYTNNFTTSDNLLYELKEKGMFKISNIPTNLYYYFFKSVDPARENVISYFGETHYLKFPFVKVNYPGTSFFIVSPIFLLIFKFRPKNKDDWILIINILAIILSLLMYYWSGWVQVGPRYMSDVLPFLYILLLYIVKADGVKNYMAILILFSAYLNWFLVGRH